MVLRLQVVFVLGRLSCVKHVILPKTNRGAAYKVPKTAAFMRLENPGETVLSCL